MPIDISGAATIAAPILVSLTAFGAAEVRRHGQLWFTRLCHEAGADGVEVRSELLVDAASELSAIAQAVRETGLRVVYSSADYLWTIDGALDMVALQHALDAATTLGAPRLKMAIGGFGDLSHASLMALRDCLQVASIELVIENDQTAGRRHPARAAGLF